MRALLVLAIVSACSRGTKPDERIAQEYRALWDARGPAMARPACADLDAKRTRLGPLLQLAIDAAQGWKQYDQPLPAPIADRLTALEVVPSTAEDVRCLLADPSAKPGNWELLGVIAVLLERKAEQAADWRSIVLALHLYRDPVALQYLYFFEPAYVLERATKLASDHPPTADQRAEVLAAARDAAMTREALCAGVKEELLVHGAGLFYGHLTALRTAFLERWGPEIGVLFTDDYAIRSRPSYAAWQAYRALSDPIAHCTQTEPTALRAQLAPLLAVLEREDAGAGQLLDVMASRLDDYGRLQAAETAFAAKLGP
jgi:hypothetical protein